MVMDTIRAKNEIAHGSVLAHGYAEKIWGWDSLAGKVRAERRAKLIAEAANLKPGMRVLEVGCGTGMFTEMFAAYGTKIVAVDISADLLIKAKQRGLPPDQVIFKRNRFEDCDIDGPFDAVIGSSVLHHLEVESALSRIYQLLKPGGSLSFAEPNALNPQVFLMFRLRFLFPYVSPDENPFYRKRFRAQLLRAGFEITEITPFDWLHPRTSRPFIRLVQTMGRFAEKVPLLREFAGSLLIHAFRPS